MICAAMGSSSSFLDRAAQVARARRSRNGLFRQIRGNGIVIREGDALVLQAPPARREHDAGDGDEILLVEAVGK